MSLFKIPAGVADKLNSLCAHFIWGSNNAKAVHWFKWQDMAKPRNVGGLGLVDAKVKNQALLNKWVWRFGKEGNSLWRRVINAKYGYDESSLLPSTDVKSKQSWVWRNIEKPLQNVDDEFTKDIFFVLGDGNSINFWDDR
ncbi:hypothetical protein like AT4G29090 [Hibiscus trionum]|uniref:Reverse transcriptase zinc-binding domain-containing protein n=1 Tax=Hibiscus trionum TaxID=183268 RepID=A0A9W7M5V0_HIBTR|nr:hypothetical protein like AT4G29090 [Hibiscus trionum]